MSDAVLHIGINSASLEDPRPVIDTIRDEIYSTAHSLGNVIYELSDDNTDKENLDLLEQGCNECLEMIGKLREKL